MMLLLSVVFVLIPLLGIAYTAAFGGGLTVDNLFLTLILLTISAVFALNAALEAKRRGLLKFGKKKEATAPAATQKQAAGQKAT